MIIHSMSCSKHGKVHHLSRLDWHTCIPRVFPESCFHFPNDRKCRTWQPWGTSFVKSRLKYIYDERKCRRVAFICQMIENGGHSSPRDRLIITQWNTTDVTRTLHFLPTREPYVLIYHIHSDSPKTFTLIKNKFGTLLYTHMKDISGRA